MGSRDLLDSQSIQVARYILGLSWMYHGLFPKLLVIAPLEQAMTSSIGLNEELSYLVTKTAGVLELMMGIAIIVFYKNKNLILLNIFALVALLIFAAVQMPSILIEAFNPVTTNVALIGLSYILLLAASKSAYNGSAE